MTQICQSCGMPLSKDPKGGGTNACGTISTQYCSYCYGEGAFYAQDVTAQDMQKIAINAMKGMGYPRPIAWLLTRNIPKLARWRDTP